MTLSTHGPTIGARLSARVAWMLHAFVCPERSNGHQAQTDSAFPGGVRIASGLDDVHPDVQQPVVVAVLTDDQRGIRIARAVGVVNNGPSRQRAAKGEFCPHAVNESQGPIESPRNRVRLALDESIVVSAPKAKRQSAHVASSCVVALRNVHGQAASAFTQERTISVGGEMNHTSILSGQLRLDAPRAASNLRAQ